MFFDRRNGRREPIALRIALADGVVAITRDIGPHGIYLRIPLGRGLDDWVRLEFERARADLRLTALGEVLRVESGEHETGVALRLHSLQLRPRGCARLKKSIDELLRSQAPDRSTI